MWIVLVCASLCPTGKIVYAVQDGEDVRQRELLQKIFDVEQSLAAEQWLMAVEQFDAAWARACEREDPLLTASGTDVNQLAAGQTQRLAGGRARLEDLFLTAPEKFSEEFLRQFEQVAEARIAEAISDADFFSLRRLTLRYAFCPAAQNGLRILARQSIDRGDNLEAALLLNRMLRVTRKQAKSEDSAEVSFQIAVCNWRAGLNTDALESLDDLLAIDPRPAVLQRLPAPVSRSLEDLQDWFATLTGIPAVDATDWRQPGGNYRRFASRSRGPARLQQTWVSDSLTVNDVLYSDQLNPILQSLRDPMMGFHEMMEQQNSVVVPVATPLRVDDLVIFRTPCGVRAVRADDGEIVWEVTHPDGRMRNLLQAIEDRAREQAKPADRDGPEDSGPLPTIRSNIDVEVDRASMFLAMNLRNQLVRTNTPAQLSASATTLFVCEDAAVASSADPYGMMFGIAADGAPINNFIRAYDLKTGLFKWEVGGQIQAVNQPNGKGNLLAGYYFLGAPLILGSRTFVMAESNEGLFLLQIAEPSTMAPGPANPRVVRSQLLTQPQFDVSKHPVRKLAGLMPSYAHGLLICPTCDERIVAVSAEDNAVRWVFRYGNNISIQDLGGDAPVLFGGRDPVDSGRVDLDSRWTDSLPRIVGNSVIVTPRDSAKLYCLDLQTGQKRWEMDRKQFHSIAAIVDEKIILCGNRIVQAFLLKNGQALWSQSIVDGIICGHPATDGHLLQIPTTEPAIVSVDVQTGRTLVTQRMFDSNEDTDLRGVEAPGNLLIIGDQLLSQNLDSIRSYSRGSNPPDLIERATERLLEKDVPGAITLLEQGLNGTSTHSAARELLIEVLMESLQSDFPANRSSIGHLRDLIAQTDADRPVATVLHLMLGMNIPDAALLPEHLNRRSQRQLSELTHLIARELSESDLISVKELAESLQSMLPELLAGQREVTTTGPLRQIKSLRLAVEIRKALNQRSWQDRIAIQGNLHDEGLKVLTSTSERSSQLQFVRDLAASGMPQLALEMLEQVAADNGDRLTILLREQIRLEMIRTATDEGSSVTELLDALLADNDTEMIRTIHNEFTFGDSSSSLNIHRLVTSEAMTNKAAFEAWFTAHPDSIAPQTSEWGQNVRVNQSDHRTVMSPRKLPNEIPNEAIPFFGSPGIFRGWSFAILLREQKLAAYDPEGLIRWTFSVPGAGEDLSDRVRTDSYITACGHLMLLNLKGKLFSLNTGDLVERMDGNKRVIEPRVLWTQDLNSLSANSDYRDYRSYAEAADRLTQFAPQLSGYYPVAPVTPAAVAVIAEQQLLVFDSLTGRLLWQLGGIARDAALSVTRDAVFVLSENSGQIQARNIVDGSPLQDAGLPEWWGSANRNVGSSVDDFEIEPGEELLWRIAVQGQSCVLFRLGTTRSSLECRDLMTDTVTWLVDLPAHSVFSNVANDVVATLSDGSELKLVRIDTGEILANLDVTPVPKPRDLFLLQAMENYIVLPEAVDDPSIDLDPVMDAMLVYGRMYCVDGKTMDLRWDEPLDHRFIRLASAQDRVILPNSPVLVLLNRGGPADKDTGVRHVRIGARVIDVRTGKDIVHQADVGSTLNDLWLRIDANKHQLELSFESHIFTLDFSKGK